MKKVLYNLFSFLILVVIAQLSVYAEEFQIVQLRSDRSHVENNEYFFLKVIYHVTDNNKLLQGVGFNIHYNSDFFETVDVEHYYEYSVIGKPLISEESDLAYDDDPETNSRITLGWAAAGSPSWPFQTLPIELMTIKFKLKDNIGYKISHFNVTKNSKDYRYSFKGYPYQISINKLLTPDINNDAQVNTIDAILLLQRFSTIY
jgi:hypothetical protein